MDQQQSTESRSRGGSSFGRFLGVVLTFGLIVSFPVFSYLTPEIRYLLIPANPAVHENDARVIAEAPVRGGFSPRDAAAGGSESRSRGRSLTGPLAGAFDATRGAAGAPPAAQRRAQGTRRTEPVDRPGAGGPAASPSEQSSTGAGEALTSGAAQAFERMDREFDQAADFVFPGIGAGMHASANPFRRALDGGSPGGSAPQGETSDPPPPSSTPPPGDDGPSPGGSDPAPQTPDEGDQDPRWSFLAIGAFQDEGELTLSKAFRNVDGRLVLENGTSVVVLPSTVGAPSRIQILANREAAISVDFNGDGVKDLVIAKKNSLGASVEVQIANPRGENASRILQFFLFLQVVEGLGVFDINSNGKPNILLKLVGNPNLLVFEEILGELRYTRELGLAVEPFLLVGTRETRPIGARNFLHIQDRVLERNVFFNSQFPGLYFNGRPATYRSSRVIELEAEPGRSAEQIVVLEYADTIALLLKEEGKTVPTFLGAFDMTGRIPTIVWGDYLGRGASQLIYVP